MKRYIVIFFLLLLGCQSESAREFEWSEELTKTTGKHLNIWLEKSPFDGKWNESETNKNTIVIDNIAQVFPFLGKFKNENDNFKNSLGRDSDIYQKKVTVFKDSQFGESFVYAALVYEDQALFLKDYYSEMGNVAFSGKDAIYESYTASLSETMVFGENEKYKTAIYWVNSNYKTYLFGFYQKGKLIFQFGFPCNANEKLKCLEKVKEINSALNLNIKEWAEITEAQLAVNKNPQSFWKDPYRGIYRGKSLLHEVKVKIKNTDFKELKRNLANEKGVDYIFAQENGNKQNMISFKKDETTLNKKQFEDEFKALKYISMNDTSKGKLFITSNKVVNGQVITDTQTYFKNKTTLKIQISYPENDPKAKAQLFDILTNIKISRF